MIIPLCWYIYVAVKMSTGAGTACPWKHSQLFIHIFANTYIKQALHWLWDWPAPVAHSLSCIQPSNHKVQVFLMLSAVTLILYRQFHSTQENYSYIFFKNIFQNVDQWAVVGRHIPGQPSRGAVQTHNHLDDWWTWWLYITHTNYAIYMIHWLEELKISMNRPTTEYEKILIGHYNLHTLL